MRVWDGSTGELQHTLRGFSDGVLGCAVSPDGAWIVSACHDFTLRVWDTTTGETRHTLEGHSAGIVGFVISPDGAWIASASWDGTVRVWNIITGAPRQILKGHRDKVVGCAVSPDGNWIVSTSADETLRVWDVATGEQILIYPLLAPGFCVTTHPWRPMAICGDNIGGLYILAMMNVKYGPIIVTAHQDEQGIVLRCPACQHIHLISQSQLGIEIVCPNKQCMLHLKINPFVIHLA